VLVTFSAPIEVVLETSTYADPAEGCMGQRGDERCAEVHLLRILCYDGKRLCGESIFVCDLCLVLHVSRSLVRCFLSYVTIFSRNDRCPNRPNGEAEARSLAAVTDPEGKSRTARLELE
jgi:hypothetical protein